MKKLFQKNWRLYVYAAYIILIALLGLYLNRFSFSRLPLGEDEMYYLGTIRRYFDYHLGGFTFADLISHPQNKLLLFYILFLPWNLLKCFLSIILYSNLIYLLFYLGGLLSFIRLGGLGRSKIGYILAPLFYVLIISNTFWLGPRYFVPSLWLYIAAPNAICAGLQKRYVESVFWLALTYFFYYFGLPIIALVAASTLVLSSVKKIGHKIGVAGLIFLVFYFFGMKYVSAFIGGVANQSIIEDDLVIFHQLRQGFLVVTAISLAAAFVLWKNKANKPKISFDYPLYWNKILAALLFFFIFYVITHNFFKEASAYRLIIMFWGAFVLVLSTFPNIGWAEFKKLSVYYRVAAAILVVLALFFSVKLISANLEQTDRDLKNKSVLRQEITLFEQVDSTCDQGNCLIISDRGNLLIGSYFSPHSTSFNYDYMTKALNDPSYFAQNDLGYDKVILIVSKRTVDTFDPTSADANKKSYSRSYKSDQPDPLTVYKTLQTISDKEIFANSEIGLYAFSLR